MNHGNHKYSTVLWPESPSSLVSKLSDSYHLAASLWLIMANTLHYTVMPEKDTLLTVQVSPDAVCKLHLDAEDEEQHLKLYADADGIV